MLSTVSVVTFHMPVTLSWAASPTPTSTPRVSGVTPITSRLAAVS